MYVNYELTFKHKGKHIFVQNRNGRRRGQQIVDYCSSEVTFPPHFYHYQSGGHVAALHRHMKNRYFFRIDIENFYYSIARNRVAAALHGIGFRDARNYAKWSCVKNPFREPAYALPIGFVQSPVLASLVIMRSAVAKAVESANSAGVFVSVYFDDFIGSSSELVALSGAYDDILAACKAANFVPNEGKRVAPSERLVAFNCDLEHNRVAVAEERVAAFYEGQPSETSIAAFERYCHRVAGTDIPSAT